MILDLSLAGFFLAVLLLEGVRRPAPGAILIRRLGVGTWRMLGDTRAHLRLVSLLPPFTTSVVLTPPEPGLDCDKAAVQRRLNTARRAALPLNLSGGVIALGLVVGLPLAVVHLTAWGFLLAAALLLSFTGISALMGSVALQKMGMPPEQASRMARRWLSPFAAPGVAQDVLELALADAPPSFAARLVLPDSALREWLRPRAYDLLERRVSDPDLMASFPAQMLMTLVRSQPLDVDPMAKAWCPRCGTSFHATGNCTDCGVPLLAMKLTETWEGFRTTLPSQAQETSRLTGAHP
jgi:hypothetical protein